MQNAELNEAQAEIKIMGEISNNLRYTDDITLMSESKEEIKSLLMKVKEKSEKAGLKLNIRKTKIEKKKKKQNKTKIGIWSYHFTANRREKVEAVQILFSWTPKPLQMVAAATK